MLPECTCVEVGKIEPPGDELCPAHELWLSERITRATTSNFGEWYAGKAAA